MYRLPGFARGAALAAALALTPSSAAMAQPGPPSDIAVQFVCVTDSLKQCSDIVFTGQPWHVLFEVVNLGEKPVQNWSFEIFISQPGATIPIKIQQPGPPLALGERITINWPAPERFDEMQKGPWQITVAVQIKEPDNPDVNPDNNRMTVPFRVENKPLVSDIGIPSLCVTDSLKNCTDRVFVRQPWHILFEVLNKGQKPVLDWSFEINLVDAAGNRIPIKTQIMGSPLQVGEALTVNWPGPEFVETQKGPWTVEVAVTVKDPGNPDTNLVNNRRAVTFQVENKPPALVTDIGIQSLCVTDSLKNCTDRLFVGQRSHVLFSVVNKGEKPVNNWSFDIVLAGAGQTIPIKTQVPRPPLAVGEVHEINWPLDAFHDPSQKGTWTIIVDVTVKEPDNPDTNLVNNRRAVTFQVENKPPVLVTDIGIQSLCVTDSLKNCTDRLFVGQRSHVLFSVVNKGEKPVNNWSFDIVLAGAGQTIPIKTQVPRPPLAVGEVHEINWPLDAFHDPSQKGTWTIIVDVTVKEPDNPDTNLVNNRRAVTFQVENKPPVLVTDIGVRSLCVTDSLKNCTDRVFVGQRWHILFDVINKGEKPVTNWSFDILLGRAVGMQPIKTQISGPPLAVGEVVSINWPAPLEFGPDDKGGWVVRVEVTVKEPDNPDTNLANNAASVTFQVENKPPVLVTDIGIRELCVADDSLKQCTSTLFVGQRWHILFHVINKGEKAVDNWGFSIALTDLGSGMSFPLKTQVAGPPIPLGGAATINWPSPFIFEPPHKGPWEVTVVVRVKEPDNPDTNLANNTRRVEFEVRNDPTAVGDPPAELRLRNVPNPFTGSTTIHFTLRREGDAQVEVYDLNGRLIRRLLDGTLAAGPHSVRWDGADAEGQRAAPGVYLYRFEAAGVVATRRMVLVN